ncbi:MAG: carbamoyltransferase [Cyclobacteriaceae bacterium]|nr:carbamoyltransferase [Cyclobacteriaceae bacterium]
MYNLGISAYYHDSAACILKDEEIIAAAQEERFSRIKNDPSFPEKSIEYCLKEAGVKLHEVNYITFYEKPFLKFERLLETYLSYAPKGIISFLKSMPIWLKHKLFLKRDIIKQLKTIDTAWEGENLLFTEHHESHLASAFFPSPYKKSIIITLDGVGEWVTSSFAIGEENNFKIHKEIHFPHSLGLLYSAFTYYLGFEVNSGEYKVMGLAPYGNPIHYDTIMTHLINVKSDGSFRLNMKYFNYTTGLSMTNKHFNKLFGNKRRLPESDLLEFHMNIAASIQKVIETVVIRLANNLYNTYKIDNLCLAGGVALNCVINGKILSSTPIKNIWIQPAAGDAGGALGAAFLTYYRFMNKKRTFDGKTDKMKGAYLGPKFEDEEIKSAITKNSLRYKYFEDKTQLDAILAKSVKGNKVIGVFRGRMEFGPRALGNRSIIGNPSNINMQSVINQKIKFRESFRPFAPSVLKEVAGEYFNIEVESPYMLMTCDVKDEYLIANNLEAIGLDKLQIQRSRLPAITHVDNSARVQTVDKQTNSDFHELIQSVEKEIGYPILINTSFNVKDEPIVCSPADAIRCFLKTDMDILVLEDFVLGK